MKRLLAILLTSLLLVTLATTVFAGWEEDANIGNVKYNIEGYAEKPVLDGKLDEFGYTKLPVAAGDISYAWDDNVDNAEALSKALTFEAYASYDANNVYVFVRYDANNYFNDYDDGDGNAWQASGVQVSAAMKDDEAGDRLEYGMWRKSNDGGLGAVIWAQHPMAKAEFEPIGNTNYVVVLDGGSLWYETVIPFNTFTDKDTLAQGDVIALSIVMVQSQPDNPGYIHTQIASGCTGNGKTAENFMRLTFGGQMAGRPAPEPEPAAAVEEAAPVAEAAPAPVVEAPAPVAVPQTGDVAMIMILVLVAVAGVATRVVMKQKSR